MTSQKMDVESCDIFSISFVSTYIHIIAIIEMSGNDARIAPMNELHLDISAIATIMNADKNTFRMKYIMFFLRLLRISVILNMTDSFLLSVIVCTRNCAIQVNKDKE